MNIFLWILQILLGLHTLTGAIWKFSNSAEQTMPTLAAIPNSVWLLMSVIEILCALGLILPLFMKKLGKFIPLSAMIIALEMFLFCGLHFTSGAEDNGPMIYWTVVTAVCLVIAYGRLKNKPIQ